MSIESRIQLSGTGYFWLQTVLMLGGVVGIWTAHHLETWSGDAPGVTSVALAIVACSLGAVARATTVIVGAAFSDSYRVFRSRHLLACSALLLVAATALAIPLITRPPFDDLFAYGGITSGAIADLGSAIAVVVCAVGAVVAGTGAWDVLRDERYWYR